jgi:hypothetical protein
MFDGAEYLPCESAENRLGAAMAGLAVDEVRQFLAVDKLYHDEGLFVGRVKVIDAADILVAQTLREANLLLQLFDAALVGKRFGKYGLYGNQFVQRAVAGPIDGAFATLTEAGFDLVSPLSPLNRVADIHSFPGLRRLQVSGMGRNSQARRVGPTRQTFSQGVCAALSEESTKKTEKRKEQRKTNSPRNESR